MILFNGGVGIIGAYFVPDWLAQSGESVVNLDKLACVGNREDLVSLPGDARHIFVPGDIGDADLIERLLAEHRPRPVVNIATESQVGRSIGPGLRSKHCNASYRQ